MPSILKKIGGAALAACLLVFWPAAAGAASSSVGPRALKGHVPPQVRSAARLERLAADENVALSLVVNLDQALLDRTLADLYGPSAGPNRRFMTPDEFIRRFDLGSKRQALKDFASAAGLAVDADEDRPGSLIVKVSGPARLVENAFGVELRHYRAAGGQVFRGHETDPVIPGELAPHLHAVLGLSDYRGVAKPHLRSGGRIPDAGTASPATFPGTGPGGGLSPADIKSIYGLSLPLTGSGQALALMELDGYNPADITAYQTQFSLPSTPIFFVSVDGQANLCGAAQNRTCNATTLASDAGMLEVALDVDLMLALANGASRVQLYIAPNTNQGLLDGYAKIASDNVAKSVSTSWGLNEIDSGGAFMTSEAAIFQQMAAQGQTIFAAAGDAGAYDNAGVGSETPIVVTDDPASQPYVTGVGGTSLSGTIGSHSETVWNEGCSPPGSTCLANGAGGGGIANYTEGSTAYWPLPSYQSGVAGTASQVYRNVPDVTLNADPKTFPYAIYVGGSFYFAGGSSAAAPLWAAVMALINQKRATNGYGTLGFANPSFYQLGAGGSYFNDIVVGNNGFYNAAVGYDNASGLGSFKADALIGVLSTPIPPSAPVSGLTAFTLGTSSIQWTWSALTGATGYDVYYATNAAQSLALAIQPPFLQTGLISDATYGILVRGENQGVEGPGAFVTTGTYAGPPGAPPVATGYSSSATFTYAACPAFPSASSCSGYVVQAALASDFSGTVFSSASLSAAPAKLALTGLAPNTGYFMRLGYLNPNGAPSFGPALGAAYGNFSTGSNLVAPVSPSFSLVSTGTIVFGWSSGANPAGATYVAQVSTASDFSAAPMTKAGTALSQAFGGLSGDASYYFRVQALGGPYLSTGPVATLAALPTAAANAFPSVGVNSLTVAWSGAADQTDTLYQADIAVTPIFSSGLMSAQVRSPVAAFSGLLPNTLYYARVQAVGRLGGVAGPVLLGSTATLVQAPTLPAQPFSGQTTGGFTFTFNQTDPPGTNYLVRVSTDPGFSTTCAAAGTTSSSVTFSGLLSNQLYNVEVAGLNQSGSPSAFATASTATLVAAPTAAAVPFTTAAATGLGFVWGAGTLAPGTQYLAQVSSSPAFAAGFVTTSSTTANAFASLSGLQPNTTYYGQVRALSQNAPDPDGPFTAVGTAATLANPPAAAAAPFPMVAFTSATVAWTPLPLAPPSAAAEGYLVQFSTAADFSGAPVTSAVGPGAGLATVSGLNYATPYYARVGSLNWAGQPDYLSLGSFVTAQPPLSSGTVAASGLALTVPQAFAQVVSIGVLVPPGAFPIGTPVSAVANAVALPPAVTNEAASITPFGAYVGLVLNASGLQPAAPVTVTMSYDPTQIPAGQNESRLQLWRYDPVAGQWTLTPSHDDPVGHVLTAQTSHFSTFAPFFVAAGSDVSAVQVFPQPWEIGDAASRYWAGALTFSGLPGGATVKVFAITGELVWSGTAAASGVLTWDGNNRFGRRAASGTYYATFQSGGQVKVRRLVIIR